MGKENKPISTYIPFLHSNLTLSHLIFPIHTFRERTNERRYKNPSVRPTRVSPSHSTRRLTSHHLTDVTGIMRRSVPHTRHTQVVVSVAGLQDRASHVTAGVIFFRGVNYKTSPEEISWPSG